MIENQQPVTEYFEVWFDDSDPQGMIARPRYLQGVDEYIVYKGVWIAQWPLGVTFSVEGGHPQDYLFATLPGWILVSDRVRVALTACAVDGIQFLPVRITHLPTGSLVGNYWLLNVTKHLEALNWERTRWLHPETKYTDKHPSLDILKPALDLSKVGRADIFRLKVSQSTRGVYVSPRVKDCLETAGATSGFKFLPTPVC